MKPNDSPQKVAENLKEYFHANDISMESVANIIGVDINEIENLFSGKQYLSILQGLRIYTTFGINSLYCSMGKLPMLENKADDFDTLLEAVIDYREAVYNEENFKAAVEQLNQEELSDDDKKLLEQTHLEIINERKEEESYLDYLIDQFDKSNIGRQKYYNYKNKNSNNNLKYSTKMTLHEAIAKVIRDAGRPLTFTEIAKAINQNRLYTREDGKEVPASQISARVKNYGTIFEVTTINDLKHVSNKEK